MSSAVPGWQTEELLEEWPEDEEEENNQSYGSRSISFTAPLNTQIQTSGDFQPDATPSGTKGYAAGTFLVREDVENVPIMPKTPGRNKKGLVKDFFTPLPLERMFEPPSPPENQPQASGSNQSTHSRHSTVQGGYAEEEETGVPNGNSLQGRKASLACQFTFSVPRDVSSRTPGPSNGPYPQAQSTPNPPFVPRTAPPPTDPRLRLFQFQYDTYTREHLSALVDSIAVNTPSGTGTGTTATPTSFSNGLSRVSEVTGTAATTSHMRSSKRIKLSPSSELYNNEDTGLRATIARPKIFGKDYVGESRSLMEKIKQARDYSTISTVASGQNNSPSITHNDTHDQTHEHNSILQRRSPPASSRRPSFLSVPEQPSNTPSSSGTATSQSKYSSSSYRQKAAALMDQIKSDVKRQKRVFSGDSELSHATTHVDDHTDGPSLSTNVKVATQDSKDISRRSLSSTHRRSSSSSKSKSTINDTSRSRASPRRHAKRLSREEKDLEHNLSRLSIQEQPPIINIITHFPATPNVLPPTPSSHSTKNSPLEDARPPSSLAPNYPSIRLSTNEDLNRFVSSSTASGTTLTAGSAPSFVKHPGPAHIRTIAPTDLPSLPDRFGDMMFDKVMMRWVKNTAKATMRQRGSFGHNKSHSQASELSDDPFGDIESLRDDTRTDHEETENPEQVVDVMEPPSPMDLEEFPIRNSSPLEPIALVDEMSRISEHTEEVEDEEEQELSNFSTDVSAHIVNFMTGVETDQGTGPDGVGDNYDDETTDSEDEHDTARQPHRQEVINEIDFDSEFDESRNNISILEAHSAASSPGWNRKQQEVKTATTSSGGQQQYLTVQTVVTTFSTPSRAPGDLGVQSTPVIKSVLKSNGNTPNSAMKSTSQSYRYQTPSQRKTVHPRSVSFSDGKRDGPIQGIVASGGAGVQSLRSKRIADMMNALEDDSELDDAEDDSPSKVSSSGRPEELQPLGARQAPSTSANSSKAGTSPRRVFSRTFSQRNGISPGRKEGKSYNKQQQEEKSFAKVNATFLTECSFGVAHDRLVEVITDAQPFEPHWEELAAVDLDGKKLESVARLKEFLPRLDALNLNENDLAWLSGIPGSVRTLSVARNRLTGLTSYGHLLNLENLDISNNEVESLRQLECLRHLRELRADNNKIGSLDGLQRMDGLVKLSVQGNMVERVDFGQYRWTRLEMLNMSSNRVHTLQGVSTLQSLIALNLDMNSLSTLEVDGTMSRLRILRVSGNRLQNLDVGRMGNLRTLYADNNGLGRLGNVDRLTRLENLSVRNQSGRGLLLTRDVRDVKRLYLSGNALESDFIVEPCYNLVYLEVAGCRLSGLPEGMGRLMPNLRVLNLNYNFLEDVRGLEGLTRLQKLTVIGSRLKHTKPLIRLVEKMPELEMVDFRMNPCTLGWYVPVLQTSEEMDSKFRRDLPDGRYMGRLAYRGLIMKGCRGIGVVDGVKITEKERMKASGLLEFIKQHGSV